jgi:hypothetical protein
MKHLAVRSKWLGESSQGYPKSSQAVTTTCSEMGV